jgi:hypothetical protein
MTASKARVDAQSLTARKISCEFVRMHVECSLDQLGHGICSHVYLAVSVLRAYRQVPFAFKRDLQAPALATARHLTRPQLNPKKGERVETLQ